MTLKPWLLLTSLSLSLTLAPAALSAFPTPDPINPYPTYIYPAQGILTSGYGWRWGRLHKGIDIAAAVGTPILAAAPGTVSFSGWHQGGYGNLVELQHSDGSMTRYAHNSRLLVKVGESVEQGQAIAPFFNNRRIPHYLPLRPFILPPPAPPANDTNPSSP